MSPRAFEIAALFLSVICTLGIHSVNGQTCVDPRVTSQFYTTSDPQLTADTVIIVEFTLACKNDNKDLNLYADFNGQTFPASRLINSDKFQVSFSAGHKQVPAGRHAVRFFDEDLYTEMRQAQRDGDDTSAVKSLFDVDVYHRGVSLGPLAYTEHAAAVLVILIWFIAYSARSELQN